jgi:hypothetical protein
MSVISLDEHHASLVAHRTGIAWLERGALAIGLQSVLAWCRRVGHQGIVTLSQQGAAVGKLGVSKNALFGTNSLTGFWTQ